MRNNYDKIKIECSATPEYLKKNPCLYLAGDGLCLRREGQCSFQKSIKIEILNKLLDSPETK